MTESTFAAAARSSCSASRWPLGFASVQSLDEISLGSGTAVDEVDGSLDKSADSEPQGQHLLPEQRNVNKCRKLKI